jgi:arsenite methyltransferase
VLVVRETRSTFVEDDQPRERREPAAKPSLQAVAGLNCAHDGRSLDPGSRSRRHEEVEMSSDQVTPSEEMARAEVLPQADASSLVDRDVLEAEVKNMYRQVAREEEAGLHFEVGRPLALELGYPSDVLDAIPAEALASFAGVGYHLDLAALSPGEAVLDLGSGSGTDAFCAAVQVGESGRVVGVDFTDEQIAKATRLRDRDGFAQVEFVEADIDALPFEDDSFDVVVSNGVVNLSPVKNRVFAEAARVLRADGRLAIADIVSGRALKERTRRNVELWAACIAGAIPRWSYLETIEEAGFRVTEVRANDYRFISERALDACSTYDVESISLAAKKQA